MQLAEQLELDERATVEAWRLQQLTQAGWKPWRAEQIAARTDIDLHTALELIRNGCPQKTALRILL